MTQAFEIVRGDASLLDAMMSLRESPLVEDEIGIKCVVVLDEKKRLTGILTQSDVVSEILFPYFVRDLASRGDNEAVIRDEDYRALATWAAKVKVRDVMTRRPVTLHPDADLFEAAEAIVRQKVKSVPVVRDGAVEGILYRSALYRHLAAAILERAKGAVSS